MSSGIGLFVLPDDSSSTLLSIQLFLFLSILTAVFRFWLVPGGLAWALSKAKTGAPIPGPSGFPLIGLIFTFMSSLTHRKLANLSQTLKAVPLMAFSVGFTRFVISSDPGSAKDILNSSAFADRPIKESAYELLFNRAMGFAPFGEYWRELRRISATYMFSPKKIACAEGFRKNICHQMITQVKTQMELKGDVEIKQVLHYGSLNNMMMTVFGKYYDFGENGDGLELEGFVSEGYKLLGTFNCSDHFPILGWLDVQGVRRRSRKLVSKVDGFVRKIIDDHSMVTDQDNNHGYFVDVLLDLERENKITRSDMVAVLWEMIFRGTDTVAILLEWILARLVLHPDIQAKALAEIETTIGSSRAVMESDIPNLPYLQAIVKETLRMHPPGPLLSWARLAIHDTHVGQYFVPAGTTAMVNMWAIAHDKGIWSEPEEFRPERFIEQDVSVMGSDMRLAPFGSGRRVCPGKTMGLATVHIWLAVLLQNFEWTSKDDVDLTEVLKMSMEMKNPLVCKVVARVF
ncbi:cytochrome P450 78A5-like [Impatiens glandulifera]|uniref:cytochrome P450 78A5-like n=1 Tax=Impatiens glandulifera TaxID=253017 RepID=UPI001FB175D6|nr:cytochrome P450 78A5-like [Impatiens glandulifera]